MRFLALALLAVIAAAPDSPAQRVETPQPAPMPHFTLTDQDGHQVTEADFRGKLMVVFFGYTNCPDICPTSLMELSYALDDLHDDAERVAPLFISVDPARDTPEVLARFVGHFHYLIRGLTGSPEQVEAAAKEFGAVYVITGTPDDPETYSVAHSAHYHIVSQDGRYVGHMPFDTRAEKMAPALKELLRDRPTVGGDSAGHG